MKNLNSCEWMWSDGVAFNIFLASLVWTSMIVVWGFILVIDFTFICLAGCFVRIIRKRSYVIWLTLIWSIENDKYNDF